MPSKGISLHIGLNFVDPDHYGGWDGELKACEFDAHDMKSIAAAQNFTSKVLLTGQATAANVIAAITEAAKALKSGDLFLVSYSGHGGQVPDTNGDETDPGRKDETWVLFDRQLIDDELWALWKKFKTGVRILVLSDSCHSGTVTRQMPPLPASGPVPRVRLLPPKQADKVYRANRALYDGIQKAVPAGETAKLKASVILISGCQDNQFSMDGSRNGLFTENVKKVWRNGAFVGGYRKFRDTIAQRMPTEQTPNYYVVGKANPNFEAAKPFTV
ncbi:MAG: caspase family protein [Verrucomicrobiales bacterium]|nr:caspase family protein [Verrucomicrobiales bacterium]